MKFVFNNFYSTYAPAFINNLDIFLLDTDRGV